MRGFFLLLIMWTLQAQTPSEALQFLLDGNERYINGNIIHPNQGAARRQELTTGQTPFATIVGCSDSRVPPEIIFDQGIGDLFIVRVAGNVVGPIEMESTDFAVQILNTSLIVVLGHESCGAIDAVMKGQAGDFPDLVALIKPAIRGTKTLEEAIKANVRASVISLKNHPLIAEYISNKKIDCIGAYYHLDSGKVEWL